MKSFVLLLLLVSCFQEILFAQKTDTNSIRRRVVHATPVYIPPCAVYANFSYNGFNVDHDDCNEYYQFTNLSHGMPFAEVTLYTWHFGDGTFSFDENPTHIYNNPGIYDVCLFVGGVNESGLTCTSEIFCKTINTCTVGGPSPDDSNGSGNFIGSGNPSFPSEIPDCYVSAEFSHTSSNVHTKVCDDFFQFENHSHASLNAYISSTYWDFGDGYFSFDTDPEHLFTAPGIYEVCLTVYAIANGGLIGYGGLVCEEQICETIEVCHFPGSETGSTIAQGKRDNISIYEQPNIDLNVSQNKIDLLTDMNDHNSYQVLVTNINGQILYNKTLTQEEKSMSVSLQQNALYFIQINSEKGQPILSKKVMFTH